MILNSSSFESLKIEDLNNLPTKTLNREFGLPNDNIELSIYNKNGNYILTDKNFVDYTPVANEGSPYARSIDIDYIKVLKDYGFSNGVYKTKFSFQRKLIENSTRNILYITEISPSRTEIKAQAYTISDETISDNIYSLQNDLLTSVYVKDYNLNFGRGVYSLFINTQLDLTTSPYSILFKLYEPLPSSINVGDDFRIIEEVINPIELEIDLGNNITTIEEGINIKGPNFNIDLDNKASISSEFRSYDDILQQGAVSSSFNNLINNLSSSFSLNLEFDNTNTPSGYHFENFIHFSSAVERLKNFEYKMRLIENYRGELNVLDSITGDITSSINYVSDRGLTENKINKIIQNFDPYERFLYFESGAFCWPKYNNTKPYNNVSSSTAPVNSWLGVEIEGYPGQYTGGQLLSASRFDDQNIHNLNNTLPDHIQNNADNSQYVLFIEMVGHHFDNIWNYIESINDINKAESSLTKGISKDFVFESLQNTGIPAFDQFENSNLFEYLLGGTKNGAFQYSSTDGTAMVSASNDSSIPKGDITKEVWKRLYHNTPYLLKTKGTERGIKALMACYGIPESILQIKEYGGPTVDKTGFRTFSYPKLSKMVSNEGHSTIGNDIAVVRFGYAFNPNTWGHDNTTKTIQVRYLPDSIAKKIPQAILAISQLSDASTPDLAVMISQSIDSTLLEESTFAHLIIATGSSENALNTEYKVVSERVPFFNGKPWNITLTIDSGSTDRITAYATQTTFNKNTYVASCSLDGFNFVSATNFAGQFVHALPLQKDRTFAKVSDDNTYISYTGSIQEFRTWKEILTKDTIVSQSLSPFNYNGNSISSSYENLVFRAPLGSNLILTSSGEAHYGMRNKLNYAPNQELVNDMPLSYVVHYPGKSVSIEETHHLTTPDTVGSGMVSDKVRIDTGTVDEDWLSPFQQVETSTQDRQPLDYSDLGVFFSPTFEINEDIIYTLGGFRMDDYIGDPRHYTSSVYPDLKSLQDIYSQKLERKYNFYDYIRTIQFFDHTLFKVIKSFTPAKANLKTGLVIEPHYLERAKIPGKKITREQQTEYLLSYTTSGSISSTNETEHLINIDIENYITEGSEASATENVAQLGKVSNYYKLI